MFEMVIKIQLIVREEPKRLNKNKVKRETIERNIFFIIKGNDRKVIAIKVGDKNFIRRENKNIIK